MARLALVVFPSASVPSPGHCDYLRIIGGIVSERHAAGLGTYSRRTKRDANRAGTMRHQLAMAVVGLSKVAAY